MSQSNSIDGIKNTHQKLYEMALTVIPDFLRKASESSTKSARINAEALLKNSTDFKDYIDELSSLIKKIEFASAQTQSFDDYNWLRDAAIKWQTVYSSTLNIPESIRISLPNKNLVLPPLVLPTLPEEGRASEDWIEEKIRLLAAHTLRCRIKELGVYPTDEEIENDHYWAQISFIASVLEGEGRDNYPSRIGRSSYWRFNDTWLKEVKEYMAYMYTLTQRKNLKEAHPEQDYQDYQEICKRLRELLEYQKKGTENDFKEPKLYIEEHYLTDGMLDLNKQEAIKQINKKAYRLSEKVLKNGGTSRDLKNRVDAETYMRMFYENIIPAVLDSNQENAKEKTLVVMKALQYGQSVKRCYHIINCFEAALAILFLNGKFIRELWDEFRDQPPPDTCFDSVVDVQSWPDTFKTPKECDGVFFYVEKKIRFKGVMTKEQRDALLAQMEDDQQKESIIRLFMKSRTVHWETTL